MTDEKIQLGYKLCTWRVQLRHIAEKVEYTSSELCRQIERITDEIDDFMSKEENDR